MHTLSLHTPSLHTPSYGHTFSGLAKKSVPLFLNFGGTKRYVFICVTGETKAMKVG